MSVRIKIFYYVISTELSNLVMKYLLNPIFIFLRIYFMFTISINV